MKLLPAHRRQRSPTGQQLSRPWLLSPAGWVVGSRGRHGPCVLVLKHRSTLMVGHSDPKKPRYMQPDLRRDGQRTGAKAGTVPHEERHWNPGSDAQKASWNIRTPHCPATSAAPASSRTCPVVRATALASGWADQVSLSSHLSPHTPGPVRHLPSRTKVRAKAKCSYRLRASGGPG